MKKLISFAVMLMLLVNMAACSSGAGAGVKAGVNTNTNTNASSAGTSGKPSISVYYMMYNNYVGNAINEFKSRFGNVEIKQKLFYAKSDDEFNKTLSTEILTGEGPDVIICDPLKNLDSISKIFSNGAFADLNEFISKDKDFKLENYKRAVINAGVFNGRREFLPIYYTRQFLFTTDSILEQNGINIKDVCSIKDLKTIVENFSKNKVRKSKYLFDFLFDFYYLMNFYGDNFLDYKNKQCNFDSTEFKDLLRLYKNMQSVMASDKDITGHTVTQSLLMKNNIIVFATESEGSTHSIFTNSSCIYRDFSKDMKIIKIVGPSSNNKLRPIIADIAAINNNSKNKEYAYEFIKVLLSDEIQRNSYDKNNMNTTYNPVNNNSFDKDLKKYSKTEDLGSFSIGTSQYKIIVKGIPLSDALVKSITDINNNIAEPVFIDKSVKEVIDDALKEYLSGKYNEDATAKLINDKVELFLNE